MACRGVMKWRRELLHICESKCFSRLRPAGYAVPSLSRRFMKRTFGAWREVLAGIMFFCPKFGQKKWGASFLFPHLVFTGESSNLFYANRNNCKTSPSRPFSSKYVQLVLSILYAAFTAVLWLICIILRLSAQNTLEIVQSGIILWADKIKQRSWIYEKIWLFGISGRVTYSGNQ